MRDHPSNTVEDSLTTLIISQSRQQSGLKNVRFFRADLNKYKYKYNLQ